MIDLSGRVAVVTGGGRGIGRAIALQLGKCGAAVIVNYHSDSQAADEVVEQISKDGGQARAVLADVSQGPEAAELVKATIDHFGKIDILVNNAGIVRWGLIIRMTDEDWDMVLDTNLKGTWNCCRAAIKVMMRQRYGRIVNVTSVAGLLGQAANSNYSASKAGIIGLTKSLAREVASRRITINAVAPGVIDTGMTSQIPADALAEFKKIIPLGDWGKAEDVAYAVAFLASDAACYITGQVLAVDGGMAMG